MKALLIEFFNPKGVVHYESVLEGQTVNGAFFLETLRRLKTRVNWVRLVNEKNWKLHQETMYPTAQGFTMIY